MKLKNTKGMTLVQIMVTTVVFVTAIIGLVGAIISTAYFIDIVRNKNIALADLTNIMEKIRATPFDYITVRFPSSVTDGTGNSYPAIVGGYRLVNEHITITYADVDSDPLEIHSTVVWEDKKGRSYSISMATFRTR